MNKRVAKVLLLGAALALPLAFSGQAGAVDAEAAKATAKKNGCFMCHAVDKAKVGPAWNTIGQKYKDNIDAGEKREAEHLLSGEMATFPDGHKEHHKIAQVENQAELMNLIDWILSLR